MRWQTLRRQLGLRPEETRQRTAKDCKPTTFLYITPARNSSMQKNPGSFYLLPDVEYPISTYNSNTRSTIKEAPDSYHCITIDEVLKKLVQIVSYYAYF